MPRGRRAKVAKAPTRSERWNALFERIVSIKDDLLDDSFGGLLTPPNAVALLAEAIQDPKTGGYVGHVEESLGSYIQRVSVKDNFSQRPPFDHTSDPIYRRLIRDFIQGAVMPESKIASLASGEGGSRAASLEEPALHFSVIDGLQRLYCYCVAILMVHRAGSLVGDGCLTQDAWDYFREDVEAAIETAGGTRAATEALLNRQMRYEVFYNIDLAGLLHYMVTFNTGQRRMSLPVQLEIMQRPLIQELEKRAKVPMYHDIEKLPGSKRPKDRFAASELVLATQAFISSNPQITASTETERFLNTDQTYLDNVGEIKDVVTTLKRLATQIHPKITQIYAADPSKRFILSGGGTFFLALSAACGYVRNRKNMKMLDAALDKLVGELEKQVEDPLNLEEYQNALLTITSSRGKATRRLVYDTFLRFFSGATTQLEWIDTAQQITGG